MQVIKEVIGIRRCVKSTLLELYYDYLRKTSVADEQIIFFSLEAFENEYLLDYNGLYQYITNRLCNENTTIPSLINPES